MSRLTNNTTSPGGDPGQAGNTGGSNVAGEVAENPLGATGALVGVILWAVGNVIIAGGPMTGLTLAFWRSWIAVALYWLIMRGRGERLHVNQFRHVWQGGAAYAIDIASFFVALTMTSLAVATTMSALQPIGILIVSAKLLDQRATRDQLLLTLVAIAGTITVVVGGGLGATSMWGNVWAVVALFTWVWYFVGSKSARAHVPVLSYQLWVSLFAGVILLPITWIAGSGTWGDLWPAGTKVSHFWAAGVVVIVSGTGHLLMNWAHAHTKLIVTSVITLLGPPLGSVLALIFLDQRLAVIQWVGIAITTVALAVFLLRDSQRTPEIVPVENSPV